MKKLSTILTLLVTLGGCATTPQPLREMHYVADGWIVAAYDHKHRIHVQARRIEPVLYAPNPQFKKLPFFHKERIVQSGESLQSIAYDEYGDIHDWDVLALANNIKLPYIVYPGEVLTVPQVDVVPELTSQSVDLDRWEVRLVNSGKDKVCVRLEFIDIDYQINIENGWYHANPHTTLYLGTLVQQPWELAETLFAFDDAKWVVNRVHVVPFRNNTCDI